MNNDLISRSALLEEVTRSFNAFIHGACFRAKCDAIRANEAVIRMLNDAPAVDAEPVRHGRWIECIKTNHKAYPPYTYKAGYECLLCGRIERTDKEPYCHCGAKMDGGTHGT